MDQVGNAQVGVEELVCGYWTFRRSCEPLVHQLELEGKVRMASWEHEGHYFAVWEPKLLREELGSELQPRYHVSRDGETKGDYKFFRSHKGAPRVIVQCLYYKDNPYWSTTQPHETHNLLTAMRPATFRVPPVIYHTDYIGWHCTIIGQIQGRTLKDVFWDVLGPDPSNSNRLNDSTSPDHFAELTRICTQVANQVVKAVVEMSKKTSDSVCGIDRMMAPDINLYGDTETALPTWREMDQNFEDAGMDPKHTVLGPGNLDPGNIVLDKDGKFVGFGFLDWAVFAPREWVQFGTIDPSDASAAGIGKYTHCALPGKFGYNLDPKSVLLLWQNILSKKLASKGFKKLDPHRLRWLQQLEPEPGSGPQQAAESCPKSESRLSRGLAKLDEHWPRCLMLRRNHGHGNKTDELPHGSILTTKSAIGYEFFSEIFESLGLICIILSPGT